MAGMIVERGTSMAGMTEEQAVSWPL